MFYKFKYQLRHKLLGILLDETLKHKDKKLISIEERAIPLDRVCTLLGISYKKLKKVTPQLIFDKYIIFGLVNGKECLYSGDNIAYAHDSEKYLVEGRKKINDNIYDVVKWIVPICLLTITLHTSIKNYQISQEIKQIKDSMQQQENRIQRTERLLLDKYLHK